MTEENAMISRPLNTFVAQTCLRVLGFASIFGLVTFASGIPALREKQQSAPQPTQKAFANAQEAAQALVRAAADFDVPILLQILGSDGKDLVSSSDPVRDKNQAIAFAGKAREKTTLTVGPKNTNVAVLSVGNDDWPFPIPIVNRGGKWYFDSKAGRDEILFRRIGSNELDAIQICRGFVEAQEEYALQKHDGAEVNQYAQLIVSSPGKHDGLVWGNSDGSLSGPIAPGIARALEQGYTSNVDPYHGYLFKILKGQGANAPHGRIDFVVGGAMIGGFALAAAPVQYRVTGVKTFIVSHDGIVYEKDLGLDTLAIFRGLELYDPDKSWRRTNDNW
jgi:hypothetical protein